MGKGNLNNRNKQRLAFVNKTITNKKGVYTMPDKKKFIR